MSSPPDVFCQTKVSNHEWHEWANFTNGVPSLPAKFVPFVPSRHLCFKTVRWSAAAGLLAALLVVVMLTIGLGVGPNLAMLERPVIPTQFGAVADRPAGAIQAMIVVFPLIFPLIGVLAPTSAVAATLRVLWMIPLLVCVASLLWRQAESRDLVRQRVDFWRFLCDNINGYSSCIGACTAGRGVWGVSLPVSSLPFPSVRHWPTGLTFRRGKVRLRGYPSSSPGFAAQAHCAAKGI